MKVLWTTPRPSSSFGSVRIREENNRIFLFDFELEDDDFEIVTGRLAFSNIVNLSVTFLPALGLIDSERLTATYDKLVRSELSEEMLRVIAARQVIEASELWRYEMCFDDGPYILIIASGVVYEQIGGNHAAKIALI